MTSFASLPQEIIDIIADKLTKTDLTQAVRVNKEWTTSFTPSLWRELYIVDRTINDCFHTPESRSAFIRNSLYIRTVETTDPELAVFFAFRHPSITHLSSLILRLTGQPTRSIIDIVPSTAEMDTVQGIDVDGNAFAILELLKKNRNLRSLSLHEWCFWNKDGKEDLFLPIIAAISPTYLEKLEVSCFPLDEDTFDNNNNDFDDEEFEEQMKGLRKATAAFRDKESFSALKELSILGSHFGRTDLTWLAFLKLCPEVERICLGALDEILFLLLPTLLQLACPKLRRLDWTNCGMDSDEYIAKLLQASKLGWRELHLPRMIFFGGEAFAALVQSAETLEVLQIMGAGQRQELEQNAVLELLCSARNLRRLEGVADGQRDILLVMELSVHAQNAYLERIDGSSEGRSWVMGPSVEYFQLQIEGVPRPDVMYRQSGLELTIQQTGLDFSLRYIVQQWIYTQLGRMTNLQELILGLTDYNPEVYSYYQFDEVVLSNLVLLEEMMLRNGIPTFHYLSLELSLASGLSLLAGLKELRVLDVRMTAHNIRVEELEWMHWNWPKLEKVRGLESDRGWSMDRDDGPAIRADVEAWMAAHPRGIGCSFYL
ncbi:hypothetical protein BGZ96_010910 [Linnemannia gamsii]|uniref:F-box domain-containing protein n=1 Tax=Linnemannia gamsii TaxID=64522 RepID=A0ABQ7JTZ2_9FUNG|nr:hypothetical protein BGZ96_010910 [Linnemannia gamsii]